MARHGVLVIWRERSRRDQHGLPGSGESETWRRKQRTTQGVGAARTKGQEVQGDRRKHAFMTSPTVIQYSNAYPLTSVLSVRGFHGLAAVPSFVFVAEVSETVSSCHPSPQQLMAPPCWEGLRSPGSFPSVVSKGMGSAALTKPTPHNC